MIAIILFGFHFFLLSACLDVSFDALHRNLAYRSPSFTVQSHGLAHNVSDIGRSIYSRQVLQRRGAPYDYPSQQELLQAVNGNAAMQLADMYDGDYGPDGREAYKGNVSFAYGVAAGDPDASSAILWTHAEPTEDTDNPICLFYEVSTSDRFLMKNIIDSNYAWTTSDVDYSFKVETTGLHPLTMYYYRFYACHDHSNLSPVGQFKTFPCKDDKKVKKVKFAVFSCSNYPFGYFHAYRQAAMMTDLDLSIHVGDYLYEAIGDGSPDAYGDGRPLNRVPLPNKEIFTLDDYRQRWKTYRSDPDLQSIHASHAWAHVWDDHEVADNAFQHGTVDSNNTAAGTHEGVNFTERKRNAVKAFFEWMPIRQVDTTDGLRIWRTFEYGTLATFFMLDTRQYDRDITDLYYNTDEIGKLANDTNRSLMGGKQERWFYKNLVGAQKAGTLWKIVAQQIVVNTLHYRDYDPEATSDLDYDAWDGYNANRRRMFNTIVANKIDNTVFLAGDSHAAWAFDTVYEEWENRTGLYDPATGRGSIAVEFAGTSVTSPSVQNRSDAEFAVTSQKLVRNNRNLQFTDGARRGYYTVLLTRTEAVADFYGFENVTLPEQRQDLLASFHVGAGKNRLTRPINGGRKPISGAVQSQVVSYKTQKWNGTTFEG